MRRQIENRLLRHFGLDKMGMFDSRTAAEFREDICFAIEENQMLAISGDVGTGKTMLFNSAKAEFDDARFVYVQNYFKEKMAIASILNALIYDLSDENPRRDLEARSRQVVRIVGSLVTKSSPLSPTPFPRGEKGESIKICVVIEEAHRLHVNTLRALKELRECEFAGISPLFSVILIGHPELEYKLKSRKEAYWRSHKMELNEANGWMTMEERILYIKKVFGDALTNDARKRIAVMCKTPLEADYYIETKMREAKRAGKRVLDGEVIKPTAREMKEMSGLSLSAIAAEAGISKTAVHNELSSGNESAAVKRAIEKLATEQAYRKAI